ncbi:MAG: hypothetical protein R3195_02675 [Gemmatimonadota bacterium]|nr:hypothetical protein [Gemmatimonadota bacterium]
MRTRLERSSLLLTALAAGVVSAACGDAIAGEREEVPQATEMTVTLSHTITSERHGTGDEFDAVVRHDVIDGTGQILIPANSPVQGHITELSEDPPRLGLSFDRLAAWAEEHDLNAELVSVTPREHSEMVDEGAKIGGGAAAGALLGAVIGGGAKEAVIGAAAGAAAGTGGALATKDRHVYLPAGSVLRIRLIDPIEVIIPEAGSDRDAESDES